MMKKKNLISILFLAASTIYLFRGMNLGKFVKSLANFPVYSLLFLIVGTLISYLVLAFRWKVLGGKVKFRGALESSIISIGINNIVPARLGDISRIFYLNKVYKVPVYKLIPVSILERVLDLAGLMLIGGIFAYSYSQVRSVIVTMVIILTVTAVIMGILMRRPLRVVTFIKKFKFKKKSLFNKIQTLAVRSVISFFRIKPKNFMLSFGITILLWLFYVLILYGFIYLSSMESVQISFFQAILIFVIVGLGVSLPSTPGSLGVYEAAFVLSMGWFNIPKESALSFALVYHIVQIILSLVLTFLIFNINKVKANEAMGSYKSAN